MIKILRHVRIQLLTENKFSKYLLYAIGEILLVVIGIYIAIELNNFNQEKHNQKITQNNIKLLIENLKNDSVYYTDVLSRIDGGRENLLNYIQRLTNPSANLDTLIQIARYEFSPGIALSGRANSDVYDAMTQSGEINLFKKDLRMEIFSLYSIKKTLIQVNDSHFSSYLENVDDFNSKFGLLVTSPYSGGPIADAIWAEASLPDLAVAFQPLFNSKRNHYAQTRNYLVRVMDASNEMLVKLNKTLED